MYGGVYRTVWYWFNFYTKRRVSILGCTYKTHLGFSKNSIYFKPPHTMHTNKIQLQILEISSKKKKRISLIKHYKFTIASQKIITLKYKASARTSIAIH